MPTDKALDASIAKAQPFAQPILKELRKRLHAAVPGLSETIKWNAPFFLLDGRIFASMAGFKAHVKFLVWKADFKSGKPDATDYTSLDELPSAAEFAKKVKAAAKTFGATSTKARVKKPS